MVSEVLKGLLLGIFGYYTSVIYGWRSKARNRVVHGLLVLMSPPMRLQRAVFDSRINALKQSPEGARMLEHIEVSGLEYMRQGLQHVSPEEMGEMLQCFDDDARFNELLTSYPELNMVMQIASRESLRGLLENEKYLAEHRKRQEVPPGWTRRREEHTDG